MALERDGKDQPYYSIALVYIGLNEIRRAVQWLERSYYAGSLWSLGFPLDPILATLHNNLYYQHFLTQISYPINRHHGLGERPGE
jgi:hypothetical protein